MSQYQSQNEAIRGLRREFPNMPQRQFAEKAVENRLPRDTFNSGITTRTFASVYGVVRRHDKAEKAKNAVPVIA